MSQSDYIKFVRSRPERFIEVILGLPLGTNAERFTLIIDAIKARNLTNSSDCKKRLTSLGLRTLERINMNTKPFAPDFDDFIRMQTPERQKALLAGLPNMTDLHRRNWIHEIQLARSKTCCKDSFHAFNKLILLIQNHNNPTPTGHPHAKNMRRYARDVMTNPEPWTLWQYEVVGTQKKWQDCNSHPFWHEGIRYRRKPVPKFININGFQVPEPIRKEPKRGTTVFIPTLAGGAVTRMYSPEFEGAFKNGMLHKTAEAATLHGQALFSFTKLP